MAVGDVPPIRLRVRLAHEQAPQPPVRGSRHARPDYTLADVIERQDHTDAVIRYLMVHGGYEIPPWFAGPMDIPIAGGGDEAGPSATSPGGAGDEDEHDDDQDNRAQD